MNYDSALHRCSDKQAQARCDALPSFPNRGAESGAVGTNTMSDAPRNICDKEGCGRRRIVITMRGQRGEDHWLVDGLRERGFRVAVVDFNPRVSLKVAAPRRGLRKAASLWLSWRGARLAATTDSVLVAQNYMAAILSVFVPAPRGYGRAPTVGLNMILMHDGAGLLPRRTLHRLALRMPGTILTVNSQHLADRYADLLRVPSNRFAVLPDCWPVGAVFQRPTAEGDYVFVGGKRRDWPTVVAAAKACPEVPFEIIARRTDWPRGLVPTPNVHVRLDTSASVFYTALRECRLALVPSLPGGNLGLLVIIHGAMSGKPVVATRTPEVEPYYPPDCSRLLVPLSDSRSIGDIVNRLWNDEQEVLFAAEKLQSHIRAEFSPQSYLAELAGIIEGLRQRVPV